MVRRRVVTASDRQVPMLEVGSPAGRPVVLIPGLTDGLGPVWLPRTRELLADVPLPLDRIRGLVVSYARDLGPATTTRDLAGALGEVLDAVLEQPAVLVAHSMGGMVAQHLAADRPELVARVVLSATTATVEASTVRVLRGWEALVAAHRFDDFVLDAVGHSFTGDARTERLAQVRADPPPHPPLGLVERHRRLTDACCTHEAADRLSAIRSPALVLAGSADAVIPSSGSRALAAGLPAARFVSFEGLGHGFPDQDPVRYEDTVVPFVLGT
ncbi:MAG: alpha/beta fold hydrolase [Nitriliruptoraceae bacterium]|nr:alpha/beta fold hydrolase [Nitriliruptoraceae bacterium]